MSVLLQVYSLLEKATQNRAVAATQCNERSSRSHSVFRLKLVGENHLTGEKCQGIPSWVSLNIAPPPNGRQGERESFFQATHWFGHPILIKTLSSTLTRQERILLKPPLYYLKLFKCSNSLIHMVPVEMFSPALFRTSIDYSPHLRFLCSRIMFLRELLVCTQTSFSFPFENCASGQ